jgi:hypothetical protein
MGRGSLRPGLQRKPQVSFAQGLWDQAATQACSPCRRPGPTVPPTRW